MGEDRDISKEEFSPYHRSHRCVRSQWKSRFGFLMAATGSAVGLGNLWRFPYLVGANGGAIFVLFYLVFLVVIGIPITLTEISLGQHGKSDPYGTFAKIHRRLGVFGILAVVCCFIHLCMYITVGGWVTAYTVVYFLALFGGTGITHGQSEAFYTGIVSNPNMSLAWGFLFLFATVIVVIGGLNKGTERANKLMIPSLFIVLIVLSGVALSLPGSSAGVKFYFTPDFSKINIRTISAALGQVFFSLGLGMGTMITYGSYLSKDQFVKRTSVIIPLLDTFAALLAGLVIFPAVFAVGMEPGSGHGLMFTTLPEVFTRIPGGTVIAFTFFISVFFAALSSSVSVFEIPLSSLIDQFGIKRRKAVMIIALFAGIIGIFPMLSKSLFRRTTLASILGKSHWQGIIFMNLPPFELMDYLVNKIFFPLGGFILCIAAGWVLGKKKFLGIITHDGKSPFKFSNFFFVIIKYVVPFAIFTISVKDFFAE